MLFGTFPPPRRMRMRHPHCCPICNDFGVKTILQDYAVTAKVKGEDREVTALAAYTCERGHIFFLCRSDLVTDDSLVQRTESI
jgi:hypothetical protein